MNYIFDPTWFTRHQKILLTLLNNPFTKGWFRWVMRVNKDISFKDRICEIQPNNYKVYLGLKWTKKNGIKHHFRADFRTHNKFSKRLYCAFYPLWWTIHQWDMLIANRFAPQLNLGFDTLTVYPDSGNTTDGTAARDGVNETWATIIAGAGSNARTADASDYSGVFASTTTNQYATLRRSFFLFDTSPLGSSANISSAVLSLYAQSKVNNLSGEASANSKVFVLSTNPSSTNSLVASDFSTFGSTSFGETPEQQSVSTSAYTDITLNASGIAAVSKTGITKYGTKFGWDFNATASGLTWSSSAGQYIVMYLAEQTGTTNDPKLVITYTIAVNNGNFFLFM